MKEQIWKWNQLKNKSQFVNFVVAKIIEDLYEMNTIETLIFYCFLKFLQSQQQLISTVFSFHIFEVEMLKKIKYVRLQLEDDENLEYIAYCYDFIPTNDVKLFIDQIRKKNIGNKVLTQHAKRLDCKNPLYLLDDDLEFLLINLKYQEICFPFYNDIDFIKSFVKHFIKISTTTKLEDFFLYDIRYVPAIPNETFLTQIFESIDNVVTQKKYLIVLLNHLQNLIDDKMLTQGIIAKILIYKLTDDVEKYKSMLHFNNNPFINFLVAKALHKEPQYNELKHYLMNNNQQSQFTLRTISNLI